MIINGHTPKHDEKEGLVNALCVLISEKGHSIRSGCAMLKIKRQTLDNWCKKHRNFRLKINAVLPGKLGNSQCAICGKSFKMKYSGHRFCSGNCSKHRRKHDEVENLVSSIGDVIGGGAPIITDQDELDSIFRQTTEGMCFSKSEAGTTFQIAAMKK